MILRELNRVQQRHNNGCFIACLAILLGKTYEEAFKVVYPNRDCPLDYENPNVGLSPEVSLEIIKKIGLKPKKSSLTRLKSLKRTALVLLRWRDAPTLLHGIVFDASRQIFLDPSTPTFSNARAYQKHLDSIYYMNVPELSHKVTQTKGIDVHSNYVSWRSLRFQTNQYDWSEIY